MRDDQSQVAGGAPVKCGGISLEHRPCRGRVSRNQVGEQPGGQRVVHELRIRAGTARKHRAGVSRHATGITRRNGAVQQ